MLAGYFPCLCQIPKCKFPSHFFSAFNFYNSVTSLCLTAAFRKKTFKTAGMLLQQIRGKAPAYGSPVGGFGSQPSLPTIRRKLIVEKAPCSRNFGYMLKDPELTKINLRFSAEAFRYPLVFTRTDQSLLSTLQSKTT